MSTELIVGLVAGGVGCLGGNYRESTRRVQPPGVERGMGYSLDGKQGIGSLSPFPLYSIPQE